LTHSVTAMQISPVQIRRVHPGNFRSSGRSAA
jgi:hypothetical protein